MHFNPMIIGAILFQAFVGAVSRTAGAIVGLLITTGILLWGLDAYAHGSAIGFSGIGLPQEVFVIAILVWYALDVKDLVRARHPQSAA